MQNVDVLALQIEAKRRPSLILIVNHEQVMRLDHRRDPRSQPLRTKYRRKRIQSLMRRNKKRKCSCGKCEVAVMRLIVPA
jgi:hypothetical protein